MESDAFVKHSDNFVRAVMGLSRQNEILTLTIITPTQS